MESAAEQPNTLEVVERLKTKLEVLDTEYKTHHYAVIDLIDDRGQLENEQRALDEHDDVIADLAIRIQKLLSTCSSYSTNPTNPQSHKLLHLQRSLSSVKEAVSSLAGGDEHVCHLQQHQEQLSDFKRELADIRDCLLALDLKDTDDLIVLQRTLEE